MVIVLKYDDYNLIGDERFFNPFGLGVNTIDIIEGERKRLLIKRFNAKTVQTSGFSKVGYMEASGSSIVEEMRALDNSRVELYVGASGSSIVEEMRALDNSRVGYMIALDNSKVGFMGAYADSEVGSMGAYGFSKVRVMEVCHDSKVGVMDAHGDSEVGIMGAYGFSKVREMRACDNSKVGRIYIGKHASVDELYTYIHAKIGGLKIEGELKEFTGNWFQYTGNLKDLYLKMKNKAKMEIFNICEANCTLRGLREYANWESK